MLDEAIVDVFSYLESEPMRIVMPFLLVFVIIYGVMQKIDLFENNVIDTALSIILSVIVIGFTPFHEVFYQYVSALFGGVAILLLSVLAFFMLAGFILAPEDGLSSLFGENSNVGKYVAIAVGVAILVLALNAGVLEVLGLQAPAISQETIAPFVVLGAIIGFMVWVVKGGKYECSKCNQVFRTKKNLNDHKDEEHNNN